MQVWQSFVGSNQRSYRKRRRDAAGNALAFLISSFAFAYLVSEATLQRFMHLLHWGTAVVVGLLVYIAAFVWLLRRSYIQGIARRKQ